MASSSSRHTNRHAIDDVIPYNSLTLLEKEPIAAGAFGAVYAAIHNEWGCPVAFKRLAVQYIGETDNDERLELLF